MLSRTDSELARRDPMVPGLAILLDPEALVTRLRRSLDREDLGTAQISYVKYQPGTNCLVGYHLQMEDTSVQIHAMAYGADAPCKLEQARNQSALPGPLGPGRIVLEDCGIVVSVFPNDRKLKALLCLAEADARKRFLSELVPDRPDLWEGTVHCLGYKPRLRYVGRLSNGKGAEAVLKVYNHRGYRVAQGNAHAFVSRGVLRLPQCLGQSGHQAVLAFEWLPGRLLSEVLADGRLDPRELANVGAALAEWHAQEPEGLPSLPRVAEATALGRVADALGFLCPHLRERARELGRQLAASLLDQPPCHRPVHGDFYAKQVLLAENGVVILDFDAAAWGDPSLDLGNFLAYLERDSLFGQIGPNRVEILRNSLLDGYRSWQDRSLHDRIELYTAVGLFRLALKPFRYREPDWPERIEAILERVEKLLSP